MLSLSKYLLTKQIFAISKQISAINHSGGEGRAGLRGGNGSDGDDGDDVGGGCNGGIGGNFCKIYIYISLATIFLS